jgi:hypothetical protein
VFLGKPLQSDVIIRINEEISLPGAPLPASLTEPPQECGTSIWQDRTETEVEVESKMVKIREAFYGTKKSEHKTWIGEPQELQIDTRKWSGLSALAESLPDALAARGGPLRAHRKTCETHRE